MEGGAGSLCFRSAAGRFLNFAGCAPNISHLRRYAVVLRRGGDREASISTQRMPTSWRCRAYKQQPIRSDRGRLAFPSACGNRHSLIMIGPDPQRVSWPLFSLDVQFVRRTSEDRCYGRLNERQTSEWMLMMRLWAGWAGGARPAVHRRGCRRGRGRSGLASGEDVARKRAVVLRLISGEPVELVSRARPC